jgi:hypothetical protein
VRSSVGEQFIAFRLQAIKLLLECHKLLQMAKDVAACDKTHADEGCHYYSWLEDYLERLGGKEAYRDFQERSHDDPEYYALVASLAA